MAATVPSIATSLRRPRPRAHPHHRRRRPRRHRPAGRAPDRGASSARKAAAGGRAVLGLATGSTPIGVYRELIRMHREEGLSFADVVTFNLDEYYPMDPESIHSYHRFMRENLFSQLDIRAGERPHPPRRRPARRGRGRVPRATRRRSARPAASTSRSSASGATGHIGFNEPGSGAESRTRLVTLDLVTRQDAAADFFGEENVPREALTMGVATILEAREIAHPRDRRAQGARSCGAPSRARSTTRSPPRSSSATRTRRSTSTAPRPRRSPAIATPWLLGAVEWTPDLMVRAVVWLSQQTRQGDPQAHAARLRRAPAVVAGGAVRLAGRAQRRWCSTRSAPRSGAARSCRATSGSSASRPIPTTT